MENSIVRKCETTIRDLINHTVSNIDKDKLHKENRTFLSKITERLHFEKQTDWSVLTSCLDVIGDSELAIFIIHKLKRSYFQIGMDKNKKKHLFYYKEMLFYF